jgi:carboxypeptidase PM20D1
MWWLIFPIFLLGFIFVVLAKGLVFTPKDGPKVSDEDIFFDKAKAVENLRALVRCKTISHSDPELEDNEEFNKFISLLPVLYPNVFKVCEIKTFPDRALLLRWKGENEGDATVLMSHYDVVPVSSDWTKPPFGGEIHDGKLYGRGALDTKSTFNGCLSAADQLILDGFAPKNDIYFAFSGGEEINGAGAKHIVDFFENEKISLSLVLDEGGAVVENVFPGVSGSVGLIGIAEKGMMNVKYSVKSGGGHASAPKPGAPIDRLSSACLNMVFNPFKARLSEPVRQMFDTLGRHSSLLYRIIFANIKIFLPLLAFLGKKSGGEMNALLRTTVAFTQAEGSPASNVIPTESHLVSNIRLNPLDDMESALEYIKKTVNDQNVSVSLMSGYNPSRISTTDCEGYRKIASAVASTWKGAIVSPYLMVQCSDSRHYGKISDKVYRFSAMDLTSEERASIHGNDERIRIETIHKTVEFYIRLIKDC